MSLAVVDANIAIRAVLPLPGDAELRLLRHLLETDTRLFAPDLWRTEITSALRRYEYTQMLSQEEADVSLENLLSLPIEVVPVENETCKQALTWARRLRHSKVYDALYLVTAVNKDAVFWTADERLWKRCRELKLSWVKLSSNFRD